jgi:hypothetical protein
MLTCMDSGSWQECVHPLVCFRDYTRTPAAAELAHRAMIVSESGYRALSRRVEVWLSKANCYEGAHC